MQNDKTFALRIPAKLVRRIEAQSKRTGLTRAEIVRRALDAYLGRREK